MSKKYQNGFFLFGAVLLAIMLSQLNYNEVKEGVSRAGYWFVAVVVLWAGLYLFNTFTWHIIIKSQTKTTDNTPTTDGQKKATNKVGFWHLYKLTISGFALNYATPGGLMGGEPYRIMALKPIIGGEKASASVILFAMTHIFSHFWFWLISVVLYITTQTVDVIMAIILTSTTVFCLLGIWFFAVGYRKGLAARAVRLLSKIPYVRRWAIPFIKRHQEELDNIDRQIASLHKQNNRTFVAALASELICRICSAAEIMFILLVLYPSVNYIDCILILAFTSLIANLLFFMPLQIGGREGGFLMSVKGMAMTASDGIFVALIVRLRELIWTAIGLLMIKIDHQQGKK